MNTAKKTIATAHKAWLAGVGAYDSGREKAVDKIDQLFVDGSQFVNELLEKGESVETQIQEKLEARKMLKGKIAALKAKLGLGNENRDHQIYTLTQRVDSLIEVVAKLAQQKAAEQKVTTATAPKKAAAKKTAKPVAKASGKTAAKPAAAKAPAKPVAKPAAAKAPAKPVAKPAAAKAPVKTAAKATKVTAESAAKPATKIKADNKD